MKALPIFLCLIAMANGASAQTSSSILFERYVNGDLNSATRYTWSCGKDGRIDKLVLKVEGGLRPGGSYTYVLKRLPEGKIAVEGPEEGQAIRIISDSTYEYSWLHRKEPAPIVWRFDFSPGTLVFGMPTDSNPPVVREFTMARISPIGPEGVEWMEYQERTPVSRGWMKAAGKGRYTYSSQQYRNSTFEEEWFGDIVIEGDSLVFSIDSMGPGQFRFVCDDYKTMSRILANRENLVIASSLAWIIIATPAFYVLLSALGGGQF